ncbi:hypothetical protein L249_2584 [Ophiocordyceps polyrhachis-furcata BCC 54312]|uniref:Uncharacterized protein n=1 Tax=Ophiocordyceps polyrhachis-furcata BCC 54312 TaxID=1330021 RepID=A0A367LP76_9HYPO|nr:hypothetical protein L249_2584 [Ophiocordyceps polyrhachis-furcata BCC 54312]
MVWTHVAACISQSAKEEQKRRHTILTPHNNDASEKGCPDKQEPRERKVSKVDQMTGMTFVTQQK